MLLPVLAGVTIVVALVIGLLAKLSPKELVLEMVAMLAATCVFYGLAILV
jgi:hypothetical protein